MVLFKYLIFLTKYYRCFTMFASHERNFVSLLNVRDWLDLKNGGRFNILGLS